MAGYSKTPLAKKLGIKPGHQVLLQNAPPGFELTLEGLPEDVTLRTNLRSRGPHDVIIGFIPSCKQLDTYLTKLKDRLAIDGGLWIAWPKKASGIATDVTEVIVRESGLATGLVDNKICAIDETWSGLRFVYRVKDRT